MFMQHIGSTPICSNNNIYIFQIITALVCGCLQQHFSPVPSYFLELPVKKQHWIYMDPFIWLQLMLHSLCMQVQELSYLQGVQDFAGVYCHGCQGNCRGGCAGICTAQLIEGVVYINGPNARRLDVYKQMDGHKKMTFGEQRHMELAREVNHLCCINLFQYGSCNERKLF